MGGKYHCNVSSTPYYFGHSRQHTDPLEKIEDFIHETSLQLSKDCNCHIPVEHFANERLICEVKNTDKVVFQSRLVITDEKNSTELLESLKGWVATDPHIVVQGIQLQVDQYCSVELDELGNGDCISTTTPPPPETTMPSVSTTDSNETESNTDKTQSAAESVHVPVSVLGGSVAAVLLLLIIIILSTVCIAVHCTRAK